MQPVAQASNAATISFIPRTDTSVDDPDAGGRRCHVLRLREPSLVNLARVLISRERVVHFRFFVGALLLAPALVHALQAPLDALALANRLVAHHHENWV